MCICSSKIVYLSSMIYIQLGVIGINGSQGNALPETGAFDYLNF